MAHATPAARREFGSDLSAALQLATVSTTGKTRRAKDVAFGRWADFCQANGRLVTLRDLRDPEERVLYLIVFRLRYRRQPGRGGKPVQSDTVGKALLAIRQGIANLGCEDPGKLSLIHI